jgi:hypothetical protein
MDGPEKVGRRVEFALFLVALLSFAYFYQGSDPGSAAQFDLMRAMVERHSLSIDGYAPFDATAVVLHHGHYYSAKAPGAAFSGLLQWILFSHALAPLAARDTALHSALSTWLTTIFTTGIAVALMCIVMYRLALSFGAPPGRSAAIALTLSLATTVFPYATAIDGGPIAAACLLSAFYLLVTHRLNPESRRAVVAGALAGWAVLCDFPALVIAGVLAVYAAVRLENRRHVAAFAAGAAAVALILIAYNFAAFDDPVFIGYAAERLPGNPQLLANAAALAGFTYPRSEILWNILIDPRRGLLYCNPVLTLVLPALGFFLHRRALRAEFIVVLSAIVAMLVLNASYGGSVASWGGDAVGPRHLAPALPLMVIALAFVPSEWNWLLAILTLVSAFLMLMATAVDPHFPYEYANPVGDFVWPAYLRGDLALNGAAFFGTAAPAGNSIAFNLGKLMGLPREFQLWPLAGFWIAAGIWMMRTLELWPRGSVEMRIASAATIVVIAAMVAPPVAYAVSDPIGAPTSKLVGGVEKIWTHAGVRQSPIWQNQTFGQTASEIR